LGYANCNYNSRYAGNVKLYYSSLQKWFGFAIYLYKVVTLTQSLPPLNTEATLQNGVSFTHE